MNGGAGFKFLVLLLGKWFHDRVVSSGNPRPEKALDKFS